MISVRNTGRVKLHKARENANGSFSIGKSWPMEELSAVENYVHSVPGNDEEAQRKQWAGDKGFTVTITKPYYWEAGTAKEKEFFIGSMVKIYNKYTKGEFPNLTGFSATELSGLTNGQPHLASPEGRAAPTVGARDGPPPNQPRQGTPELRQIPPKSPGPPPRRPGESPLISLEDGRRGPSPTMNPNFRRPPGEFQGPRRPGQPDEQSRGGSRPSTGDDSRRPPPFIPNQGTPPLPNLRQQRSLEQNIRSRPSGDNMRIRPGPGPSPGREPMPPTPSFSPQNLTPQSSTSEFINRPKTPESNALPPGLSSGRRPPGDDAQLQRSNRFIQEASFNGAVPGLPPPESHKQNGFLPPGREPSPRGLRPGTSQSNASSNFTRNEDMPPEEPPQRRRPFMDAKPSLVSQRSTDSQITEPRTLSQIPAQPPAPPIDVLPQKRPQEIPERPEVALQDGAEPPQGMLPPPKPSPPLVSPVPQVPATLAVLLPQSELLPQSLQPPKPVQTTETVPDAKSTTNAPESAQSAMSPTEEKNNEVSHRPGLGPMVKKTLASSEAANKFRKAAVAAGAFKPRAGGAAAKLFSKDTKTTDEPDGVSAVFVPQRPTPTSTPKEELERTLEERPASCQKRHQKNDHELLLRLFQRSLCRVLYHHLSLVLSQRQKRTSFFRYKARHPPKNLKLNLKYGARSEDLTNRSKTSPDLV